MVGLLKTVYQILWALLGLIISGAVFLILAGLQLTKGYMALTIIIFVLFLLGTYIFVVAKMISYFQAQFLYRDSIDGSGATLSYNQAITKSKQLMNGHKWEYFLLALSFIGWYILNGLTVGILGFFFLTPYVGLTFANYYVHLVDGDKDTAQTATQASGVTE